MQKQEQEQTPQISDLESYRRELYVSAFSGFGICLAQGHGPTYIAQHIQQGVETFLSEYQENALIPVHTETPLSDSILSKIAGKDGIVVRTVKIPVDEFYPFSDEDRLEILEEALVKNLDEGSLSDIKWEVVGFCDQGRTHFIKITAQYMSNSSDKPRGRNDHHARITRRKSHV